MKVVKAVLPYNNAEILQNPEAAKDNFFLLAEVVRTGDGVTRINIHPKGPILVAKEDHQREIKEIHGVTLPLRAHWVESDKRRGYALPKSLRKDRGRRDCVGSGRKPKPFDGPV